MVYAELLHTDCPINNREDFADYFTDIAEFLHYVREEHVYEQDDYRYSLFMLKIKEHTNTSGVCSYFMYENHYTYSGVKYSISKYLNGEKFKQLLMPVKDKRIAEAVWAELEANDWRC